MMLCKDCVHYEVCKDYVESALDGLQYNDSQMNGDDCEFFKGRSRFVVFPCKIGDKLYTIVRGYKIRKWIVTDIFISDYFPLNETVITARDKDGSEHMRFAEHYLGKTVFLTIEEAEQALKLKAGDTNA